MQVSLIYLAPLAVSYALVVVALNWWLFDILAIFGGLRFEHEKTFSNIVLYEKADKLGHVFTIPMFLHW